MLKWIQLTVSLALVLVIASVAYRLANSKVELEIYRERLAALAGDYESLRDQYNQAVRKTAVTELIVKDNHLSLAIRTIEGVDRVIDTPYDPRREIYCDYVLADGRMWIRRIYDAATPPSDGLLIDPGLAEVDWNSPAARHGHAIYRALGEGRWIVTVTGDGSLGLARVDPATEIRLSGPPPVRDYEEMLRQIDDDLSDVTTAEKLKRMITGR